MLNSENAGNGDNAARSSSGRDQRLRELVATQAPLILPGIYDALSARICEEAGFGAVYISGWSVAAANGVPDHGLLTMSEIAHAASRIVDATSVPVVVDADEGYGGVLQVMRTVRELARAGVSGIQLEDQASPKRCGSLEDISLVSIEEMVAKVRAARDLAPKSTVIIARTDALGCAGLEEAVRRAQAFEDAGADWIYVAIPRSDDEIREITRVCKRPVLLLIGQESEVPQYTADVYAELGVSIVCFPTAFAYAGFSAIRRAAKHLIEFGRFEEPGGEIMHRAELFEGLLHTRGVLQEVRETYGLTV